MADVKRLNLMFAGGILAGLAVFTALSLLLAPPRPDTVKIGVTFSSQYATSLGLDWRATYLALLDDLRVRKFRIPVYWNDVEKTQGQYDWTDVDWMLNEADKRGAEVILVLGRKVPRWPECHIPDWAKTMAAADQEQRVLGLVKDEVAHFKAFPAVRRWQVENEALFYFGICPRPHRELLEQEAAEVRAADSRPLMITDSGELSTWLRTAPIGDTLGISLYRLVRNSALGGLYWPVTPGFYSVRTALIKVAVKDVIISELQAEPWFWKPADQQSLKDQFASMDPVRFRKNLEFARLTGASEIYLWGAEWWYWLKEKKANPVFWESVRPVFL